MEVFKETGPPECSSRTPWNPTNPGPGKCVSTRGIRLSSFQVHPTSVEKVVPQHKFVHKYPPTLLLDYLRIHEVARLGNGTGGLLGPPPTFLGRFGQLLEVAFLYMSQNVWKPCEDHISAMPWPNPTNPGPGSIYSTRATRL